MKGTIENSTYAGKYVYAVCSRSRNIIPTKLYFFDEKGMIISCNNSFDEELPPFTMMVDIAKKESFDHTEKMPYLYKLGYTGKKYKYALVIPIALVGYANENWSIKWDDENKYPTKAVHSLTITGMNITINCELNIPTAISLNECRENYNKLVESLLAYDISNYRGKVDKIVQKMEMEYLRYATINNALISYTVEDFFRENPDIRSSI